MTHRVGCSLCYTHYKEEIQELRGENRSAGREPLSPGIIGLTYQLDQALAREEYELAARLRDELSEIGANEYTPE